MSNGLQQYRRLCKLAAVSGMCFCLVLSLVSCAGGPRPSASVSDTRLHDAARDGRKDVVSELIERGARVDARGKDDNTPLHYAASKGHRGVVELLIAKGADVNARDERGKTPLDYALKEHRDAVVELLRSHSAGKKR